MKKYTEKSLRDVVKNSLSYKMVLDQFERNASGSSYDILKRKLEKWDIDTNHFLNRSEMAKHLYKQKVLFKRTHKEVFVKNSTVSRAILRRRALGDNIVQYLCEMCGSDDTWKGKKIALILDHINGIRNDNRIENLRFLCPNCNATLPTHCKGGYDNLAPVAQMEEHRSTKSGFA